MCCPPLTIAVVLCGSAAEEDVELTAPAKQLLISIAEEASLRYAIHLITTASLVAMKRNATHIDVPDIKRVYDLFVDVKRSSEFLNAHQQEYMFSEESNAEMTDA
jgi:RuvB-like protein 2